MRSLLRPSVVSVLGLVVFIGAPRVCPGTDGRRDRRAARRRPRWQGQAGRHPDGQDDAHRGERDRDDAQGDRLQEAAEPHARRAGTSATWRDHDPARHQRRRRVGHGAGQGRAAPAAAGRRVARSRWRLRRAARRLAGEGTRGRASRGAKPCRAARRIKLTVTLKSGLVRTIYLDAKTYLDRRHTGVLNLPKAGGSTSRSTSTTGATSMA